MGVNNTDKRLGCGKLSYEIIKKIDINNISSLVISFLTWLSMRQDAVGYVYGVNYNVVQQDLGLQSCATFYNVMAHLEENNYITYTAELKGCWKVFVKDNCFTNSSDDKKGYITTNRDIFRDKRFINLRVNEKKIIMLLIKYGIENHTELTNMKPFALEYNTLTKWIGISNKQLLNSYLKSVGEFLDIEIKKIHKKTIFSIQCNNASISCTVPIAVADVALTQFVKYNIKLNKLKNIAKEKITDTVILFKQYGDYFSYMLDALQYVINFNNDIIPIYIHKKFKDICRMENITIKSNQDTVIA